MAQHLGRSMHLRFPALSFIARRYEHIEAKRFFRMGTKPQGRVIAHELGTIASALSEGVIYPRSFNVS